MAKSALFDLFQDTRDYTITDVNGNEFMVRYRALRIKQRKQLAEILDKARTEAREKLEDNRDGYMIQLKAYTRTRLIDDIVRIDRVVAQTNSDIAPNTPTAEELQKAEDPEALKKQREDEAVAKWEEQRRAALEEADDEDLRKMLCDKLIEQLMASYAMDKFLEVSVCQMVLDPLTNQPVLSLDENADNFIDDLMPETREALFKHWREFVERNNARAMRDTVKDPDFLSSGESQKPANDSPGVTTETS